MHMHSDKRDWFRSCMALRCVFWCCLMVLCSATYPAAQAPSSYGSKDHNKPKFVPAESGTTPDCLENPRLTYCTDPDDYPKERIVDLLKNNVFNISTLMMDETRDTYTFEVMDAQQTMYNYQPPQQSYLPPMPTYNTTQYQPARPNSRMASQRHKRQTPSVGPTDLCPSRANYLMPRAAQSIKGDWMYLVNVEDINQSFTQLVRTVTCIQNRCSGLCQAPPGSIAVCQQQFVQRRLVALAGGGDRLNQDIFWFPSCCVCKIRRG